MEATNEKPFLTRPLVVTAIAVFCCLLWGSAFPCIKIGYGLFGIEAQDTASQMLFAGMRFGLAGVLVLAFNAIRSGGFSVPPKEEWRAIAVLALFQTFLQYLFLYFGLAYASSTSASIVEGAYTFFAVLLGAIAFRQERLTSNKVVGCIVGFAGVLVVVLAGSMDVGFALAGEGAVLLSTISAALATCLIRIFAGKNNPVELSGWQFLLGGIGLCVCGLACGGHLAPTGASAWLLLVYLACVAGVAYTLWYLLLAHNDVSRVATFAFLNPVFGVILSALLLGEASAAGALQVAVALVLVSAGIVLVNVAPKAAGTDGR